MSRTPPHVLHWCTHTTLTHSHHPCLYHAVSKGMSPSPLVLERMREGHCQSDKRWNCFKGNIGELLRDGVECMYFSKNINTILNWTGSKRACLLVQHFWISKGMFFSTTLLDLKRACLLVQHFCIVCVNTVTIFKLKNDPQTSCYLVKLCFNGISNSMLLVLPLIP